MNDIQQWNKYEKNYKIRDYVLNRIVSRHITMPLFGTEPHIYYYGGKMLHGANWTSKKISKLIDGDDPFMVARFGNTELNVLNNYMGRTITGSAERYQETMDEWWENLYTLCGFFPRDVKYQKPFSEMILDSAMCTDVLGVWNRPMEDYYLKTRMPNTSITALRWLEPWYSDKPWTHALKGKKILVIHPFEKSIRQQYEKRELIFPDGSLPEFELDVIKAVQTVGDATDDRFATWFDALEYMYQEAMKRDFDVAIIGCGAYGMPLAAKLKKAGKKAIHMGGVTQCLFGIKGSRWVNSPIDKKIPMNDHWKYPDLEETPEGAKKVEGGCYW